MKTRSLLAWLLICAAVPTVTGSQEAFSLGRTRVPSTLFRIDPHPKWVSVPWNPREDAPFLAIRRAMDAETSNPLARDASGKWTRKVRDAFETWMRDCQNPINLYRVSATIGAADLMDPGFRSLEEYPKFVGYVNRGWAILRVPPHSYEFARRGYISNADDGDHHVFGDLPFRLLKRDPYDRSVAVAMTGEYRWRKPVEKFEQVMFSALERVSKTKQWRPWDDFNLGMALRSYGFKHRKVSAYATAITRAESALKGTPEGWNSDWIVRWIKKTREEMQKPDFGFPKDGKYIDDLDPP